MKTEIVTITPEMAQAYLAKNTNNRRIRPTAVDRYACDMRAGKWDLTHQGLAFNCDGTLLDGQHRLAAIVEAGVPVTMMVTTGVSNLAQRNMDSLIIRKPADALSLSYGKTVTDRDVAIAKVIFYTVAGKVLKPSNSQVHDLLCALQNSIEWSACYRAVEGKGIRSAPVWAAICLAYYYEADLGRLSEFCSTLVGHRMAAGDSDRAAQLLRESLISAKISMHNAAQRTDAFLKTQRATHAFCRRESLSKIYATKQYYTWPLDRSAVRE